MTDVSFGPGMGVAHGRMNYPTPFMDYELKYLPKTLKELFKHTVIAFMSDTSINPALERLTEYPITHLIYSSTPEGLNNTDINKSSKTDGKDIEESKELSKWKEILEDKLKIKSFLVKLGLDHHVYGNGFASVYKPFHRYLVCTNTACNAKHPIKLMKYKWRNFKFEGECPNCKKNILDFNVIDEPIPGSVAKDKINFIRWSPYNIAIEENSFTGETSYIYEIPNHEKQKIMNGDKKYIEDTPWEFIEAVKNSTRGQPCRVEFNPDDIFHLCRVTVSLPDAGTKGWGLPLIVSTLKSLFYLSLMRRAQSMILLEHILPFRIMYPQPAGESVSTSISLPQWHKHMRQEIIRWKRDPLHIMLSPMPIGYEQLGGQGRALMLYPEMEQVQKMIISGVGVPQEFVYGGLQWSGASVSIRMLENIMLTFTERLNDFIDWVIKKTNNITGLKRIYAKLAKFKMADDIQTKQLFFNMWTQKAISHRLLSQIFDFDSPSEIEQIKKEQIIFNEIMGMSQAMLNVKGQTITQFGTPSPLPGNYYDNQINYDMTEQVLQMMDKLPPEQQQKVMQQINSKNPPLSRSVDKLQQVSPDSIMAEVQKILLMPNEQRTNYLNDMRMKNPSFYDYIYQYIIQHNVILKAEPIKIDNRPLPTTLPPRRDNSSI